MHIDGNTAGQVGREGSRRYSGSGLRVYPPQREVVVMSPKAPAGRTSLPWRQQACGRVLRQTQPVATGSSFKRQPARSHPGYE